MIRMLSSNDFRFFKRFCFCRRSGQQGQQPQDYTKAWEEYYKKQGEILQLLFLYGAACGQLCFVLRLSAIELL